MKTFSIFLFLVFILQPVCKEVFAKDLNQNLQTQESDLNIYSQNDDTSKSAIDFVAFSEATLSHPSPLGAQRGITNLLTDPHYSNFLNTPLFIEEYRWLHEVFKFSKKRVDDNQKKINKWQDKITVSVGFPNDLKSASSKSSETFNFSIPGYPSILGEAQRKEVYSYIYRDIEELSRKANIKINFIDPSLETVSSYAKIRLVFINDHRNWETPFKRGKYRTYLSEFAGAVKIQFRDIIEDNLYNRYEFTPNINNNHVDGYFLTDNQNNIKFSVCYIWKGHDSKILESLISECLIRSLGIPNRYDKIKDSIISSPELIVANTKATYLNIIQFLYSNKINPSMSEMDIKRLF